MHSLKEECHLLLENINTNEDLTIILQFMKLVNNKNKDKLSNSSVNDIKTKFDMANFKKYNIWKKL